MTNTAMNATYNHANNLPNAPAMLGYSLIAITLAFMLIVKES